MLCKFRRDVLVIAMHLPKFSLGLSLTDTKHYTFMMAAYSIQHTATTVPRFLLPQFSWAPRTVRPVASVALEARRHYSRSSPTSPRRTTSPIASALQQTTTQAWQKRHGQHVAGFALAREFSATTRQTKDHHFDTLKFVQRMKEEGFTDEQAEGMMRVLSDVIEERYA